MAICNSVFCANFPKAIYRPLIVNIVNEFLIWIVNNRFRTTAPLRDYLPWVALGLINNNAWTSTITREIGRAQASAPDRMAGALINICVEGLTRRILRLATSCIVLVVYAAPARWSLTGRGQLFMTVSIPNGSSSSRSIGLRAAHGVEWGRSLKKH